MRERKERGEGGSMRARRAPPLLAPLRPSSRLAHARTHARTNDVLARHGSACETGGEKKRVKTREWARCFFISSSLLISLSSSCLSKKKRTAGFG